MLILALATILLSIGACRAGFSVLQIFIKDPDSEHMFGSAKLHGVSEILSITSPAPHLIMAGAADGDKNTFMFRGSLPNCDVPVTLIVRKPDGSIVKISGTVNVGKVDLEDTKQGVEVKGDDNKIKMLLDELKKIYKVDLISSNPSNPPGTSDIAIILRDPITGKVIPKPDAEKIIGDLLNKNGLTDLDLSKPNCAASCSGDICDSVLVIETTGQPQVAQLVSVDSHAFAGMPSKWERKCGKDVFTGTPDVCGSTTCKRKGTCNPSSDGPGNMCTCLPVNNDLAGPQCQLLSRGFTATSGSQSIITHHPVRTDGSTAVPNTFTFSFEHISECRSSNGLCSLLRLVAGTKELIMVEQGRVPEEYYTSATLPSSPPNDGKMKLQADKYVQNSRWMHVTVTGQLSGGSLRAVTVFCSKETVSACFEKKSTISVSGDLKLSDVTLSLGGAITGCFRNVRLNGRLVDLSFDRHTGDVSLTRDHCLDQHGCGNNVCGDKSQCYGTLKTVDRAPCGCKCSNNGRTQEERLRSLTKCSPCHSAAPFILNMGSSGYDLSWAMADGSSILLEPEAALSLKFRMRTKQSGAAELVKIDVTTKSGARVITAKIESEVLSFCLDSSCFAFIPKPVSDGRWHDISVRLAKSQLVLRVDAVARSHTVNSLEPTGAKLIMRLASSCISNIRLSEVYMPTSASDVTQDSSSAAVKLSAGGSVSSGLSCNDPGPACSCDASSETCADSWGAKSCVCKPGFKRPSSAGTCTAPSGNPCTRLGIRCPNPGGKCVEVGGKWQVCQ